MDKATAIKNNVEVKKKKVIIKAQDKEEQKVSAKPQAKVTPSAKTTTIDGRNLPEPTNNYALRKFKKFWKLGNQAINTQYFDFTTEGDLTVIEGNYQYNIREIVEKYGTPLEIFFPFIVEERVRDLIDLFNFYIKYYKYRGKFYYHYPMKVNQNKEFILSVVAHGANLEVGSYNELFLVKKLWEQGSFNEQIRVICNGPKTPQYLELIEELRNNNLSIIPIIEDQAELEYLSKYKGEVGIRVDLELKVTSRWDKKINRYGFSVDELKKIEKIRNLKILHYHIGSQIELVEEIMNPVRKAMDLYIKIKKKNPSLDTLDIGGGFPIPYDRRRHYSADGLVRKIIRHLQSQADNNKISPPNIICEWGRYVVAPSQITIFKVISQKKIPKGNAKHWYIIDGSFMNDLLDTWAIHQSWHVVPVNKLTATKLNRCWLAGSSCDSDDKYVAHGSYILLPRMRDLKEDESLYIAFLDSGAYQDALASHHCLLSSPAKLLARNGEVRVIRRRETPDDVGKLFGW